jgi:hypothetical protein
MVEWIVLPKMAAGTTFAIDFACREVHPGRTLLHHFLVWEGRQKVHAVWHHREITHVRVLVATSKPTFCVRCRRLSTGEAGPHTQNIRKLLASPLVDV